MNELRSIAHRAMIERGLEPDFPAQAQAEMQGITTAARDAGVVDQRALSWCSIDNDSSRDLDQLSVAEALADGSIKVLVAVADVDATVKRGSALDEHAKKNTTSVYTAAQIFPMLPERLSTDLTSLNENAERLAIVTEYVVAKDGAVGKQTIYRALVFNRAKLAYNSVAAWLEGTGPAPTQLAALPGLEELLRLQDRAAQALRARRFRSGALSLQTDEPQAVFRDDVLSDLKADPGNRAKELIEDFMVAANGVAARFLADKGLPSIRRVLRSPERWERIVALAAEHGTKLPGAPDGTALATFLTTCRAAEPAQFADLSLAVVKLLGRGEYAFERPGHGSQGHFGLAVKDYAHSTAPNRRFPDLITQRLLKAALAGTASPYTDTELDALAKHCTDQETNADKVERQVRKSAAAALLGPRIGERFDGVVTGASEKGTYVRIVSPIAEGRIVRGFQGLDVGQRVRVELLHTDMQRGFVDFGKAS